MKLIFARDKKGEFEKSSEERKRLLTLIRHQGNLEPALNGAVKPKRQMPKIDPKDYVVYKHCNGFYKRTSISRHLKKCFAKPLGVSTTVPETIIYSASLQKYGDYISKMAVKDVIFVKMRADERSQVAISDLLIAEFAEFKLKAKKKKRNLYSINQLIRDCGRFLIRMRLMMEEVKDFLSILQPKLFRICMDAVRVESKFSAENDSFGAPSFALHFGTTLGDAAGFARTLCIEERINHLSKDQMKEMVKALEDFRFLVEERYHTEIGSLALKDLQEKKSLKPKLVPLTADVIKLKEYLEKAAEDAFSKLKTKVTKSQYRILLEVTLVLLNNRKRQGDAHYMERDSYIKQINQESNHETTEFTEALSPCERILTQHYKRIVCIGKLSRLVVVLIPKHLRKYCDRIYEIRENNAWNKASNNYFFSYPDCDQWISGCKVIHKYARLCQARKPELLTFTHL